MKYFIIAAIVMVFTPGFIPEGIAGVFNGRIVDINRTGKTIAVKEGKQVVRFDAANPVFSGYRNLDDVQAGDKVAVSYTPEGLMIKKITGRSNACVAAPGQARKGRKDAPGFSRRAAKASNNFENLDENKDGRIMPVELCVFIPGLTMDQFHQYDKNGDGYLDQSELRDLIKVQGR